MLATELEPPQDSAECGSKPKLIAAIATEHAVEDIHVDEPAIEEVIARFYDLHDAREA